jgi:hypothetical protein
VALRGRERVAGGWERAGFVSCVIVASSRAARGGVGNEDEAFAPIFPGGGRIVATAPGWR